MPRSKPSQRLFTESELEQAVDQTIDKTAARYERKIDRLEEKIQSLYAYIERLEAPKKRGRPPKVTLATFFRGGKRPKNSGRPPTYSVEDILDNLAYLEKIKAETAKELGCKSVTNKQAIEHFVEKYEARAAGDPHLSQRKKREVVDEWLGQIKYFRDRRRSLIKSGKLSDK